MFSMRHVGQYSKTITALIFAISTQGCVNSDSLFSTTESIVASGSTLAGSFQGCVSGTSVDTQSIELTYEFPANASQVTILRNGIAVYTAFTSASSSYLDIGLRQGATYTYNCQATIKGVTQMGSKSLQLSTQVIDAPTFGGITAATALTANTVRVTWSPPPGSSPVTAKSYQIFATLGGSVVWSASPKTTTTSGTSVTVTNLGAELPYAFGVRACSEGSICDTNTTQLTLTTPAGGAPTTAGITAATASSNTITLTAPWTDANGALTTRFVYVKVGGILPTGLDPNVALTSQGFSLAQSFSGFAVTAPTTALAISGIVDNQQYYFVVQDTNPSGVSNKNTLVHSILTGDTTAPTFGGITSLTRHSPEVDSSIDLGFTAIAREGTGDAGAINGATSYLVYTTSVAWTVANPVPANACVSGTLRQTAFASAYAPGAATITLTGLTPRTTYSICLKAQDLAGNTSNTLVAPAALTTLDLTPPVFFGAQSLSFSNNKLHISWSNSSSSDSVAYTVSIWNQNAAPSAAAPGAPSITTLSAVHPSYQTDGTTPGLSFSSSQFAMTDSDQVHVVVNACDNANTLPSAPAQNCTTYAYTYPGAGTRMMTLPVVSPPPNFLGVFSVTSTVAGQATINWNPAQVFGAKYSSMQVYHVATPGAGAALTALGTCVCTAAGNCANVSPCTITGLDPYRTYKFYAQAVDSVGNSTSLPDASNIYSARVIDTTAPGLPSAGSGFASSLTMSATNPFPLSWSAAVDNQYASEPGIFVRYRLYRKNVTAAGGATFTNTSNPAADGAATLQGSALTSPTYTDSGWTQGSTYDYIVCAYDTSNNQACDSSNVLRFVAPDTVLPIITTFTSTKLTNQVLKKWTLSWGMSDNATATGSLSVQVYQTNSALPQTLAYSDIATLGLTPVNLAAGSTSYTEATGPVDVTNYVNYLLVVSDATNNRAIATHSVLSANAITLGTVGRNRGPTAGGKLLYITGTGFSSSATNGYATSTTVTIGGAACTGVSVIDSRHLTCTTPTGGIGAASVVATNPEGSVSSASTYTYDNPGSPDVCDVPANVAASPFAAGVGTLGDPYIICSSTQFNAIRNAPYLTGNFRFKLGENIDLTAGFASPMAANFAGHLDGNHLAFMNWTYSAAGSDSVGLFGSIGTCAAGACDFKNLGLLNFTVTGRDYVGGFIAITQNLVKLSNIYVSGTITARSIVGSLGGQHYNRMQEIVDCGSSATINATGNYAGGLVGIYQGTVINSYATGNVTSTLYHVGGLFGSFSCSSGVGNCVLPAVSIDSSWASGNITGANNVGGLAGTYNIGSTTTLPLVQNSYATGNVTLTAANYSTGGFIGNAEGLKAYRSYATGNVSTSVTGANYIGGFVGYFLSNSATAPTITIDQCYATGSVTCTGTCTGAGGLVGSMNISVGNPSASITDSYALGNVTSLGNGAGAVIGTVNDGGAANRNTITRVYGKGTVNNNTVNKGGIFGYFTGTNPGTVTGSFYDTTTTGMTTSAVGGTSQTTTQMQTQGGSNIYTGAGWTVDAAVVPLGTTSASVWKFPAASSVYPVFGWQ